MKTIVLCADRMSLEYPIALGLSDEQPLRQPWLKVVHSGAEVRSLIRSYAHEVELWVASSDDIAPINIAAMVKQENPLCTVCLVTYEASTGSLKSRTSRARIDCLWTPAQFLERYREEKQRFMNRGAEDAATQGDEANFNPGLLVEGEACEKQLERCGQLTHNEASAPTRLLNPEEIKTIVPAPLEIQSGVVESRLLSKASQPDEKTALRDGRYGKRKAFVLSVVSGSGGAGKSTISAIAALLSQMKGYKTLLIDLDMQFGDIPFMLGAQQVTRLDEVVSVPAKIDQLKCQTSMPAILGAPLYMEQTEDVAFGLADVLDAVSDRFDVVVANTGSFWADQHIALLERSAAALFLVDQRPSSLRACKHALELCARCGIASSPFVAVANRCQKGALYTSIDVSCALRGMPAKELREGGPEVEECLSSGQIGDLIKSKNELCLSVDALLGEFLPALDDEAAVEVFGDQKTQKGVLGLFRKKAR